MTIIIFIVLLLGESLEISQTFLQCADLTSIVLMNGLLGLSAGMFQLSGLTSVLIPSTITSIGLIVVVVIFGYYYCYYYYDN